jgi:hypothetical protein
MSESNTSDHFSSRDEHTFILLWKQWQSLRRSKKYRQTAKECLDLLYLAT